MTDCKELTIVGAVFLAVVSFMAWTNGWTLEGSPEHIDTAEELVSYDAGQCHKNTSEQAVVRCLAKFGLGVDSLDR